MTGSILVVDDDARIRESLARVLGTAGYSVSVAATAETALAEVGRSMPGLVISDVRMPGMDGLQLLTLLRQRAPEVDVILMTAYEDLPTVATAMREGAVDFLVKPIDLHKLRLVVERVFDDRRTRSRVVDDDPSGPARADPLGLDRLVGRDPGMVEIFKVVGQLAASRATVLIRGESGTGKELIARAIHFTSEDAREPFVAVNCTALPATLLESELFGHTRGAFTGAVSQRAGRFALAGRGTIFLDEIGDTSPDFQGKLLRVLQEREFYPVGAERAEKTDARVMAATHRDLENLVKTGAFREDLYYRLRVVEIRVPPLRERAGDLPELTDYLIRKAARAAGKDAPVIAVDAIEALECHNWPGNVRELENCLTRAVVLAAGDVIHAEHVAPGGGDETPSGELLTLDEMERRHVERVLRVTRGNKSRAAEILGISRPRLRRLLEKFRMTASAGTDAKTGSDAAASDATHLVDGRP